MNTIENLFENKTLNDLVKENLNLQKLRDYHLELSQEYGGVEYG